MNFSVKSNANQVAVFNLTNFSLNQSKIKLHGMVLYYSIDLRIFPSNQLQIKLSDVIQFHEIFIKSNGNQFAVIKFPNFSTK